MNLLRSMFVHFNRACRSNIEIENKKLLGLLRTKGDYPNFLLRTQLQSVFNVFRLDSYRVGGCTPLFCHLYEFMNCTIQILNFAKVVSVRKFDVGQTSNRFDNDTQRVSGENYQSRESECNRAFFYFGGFLGEG